MMRAVVKVADEIVQVVIMEPLVGKDCSHLPCSNSEVFSRVLHHYVSQGFGYALPGESPIFLSFHLNSNSLLNQQSRIQSLICHHWQKNHCMPKLQGLYYGSPPRVKQAPPNGVMCQNLHLWYPAINAK